MSVQTPEWYVNWFWWCDSSWSISNCFQTNGRHIWQEAHLRLGIIIKGGPDSSSGEWAVCARFLSRCSVSKAILLLFLKRYRQMSIPIRQKAVSHWVNLMSTHGTGTVWSDVVLIRFQLIRPQLCSQCSVEFHENSGEVEPVTPCPLPLVPLFCSWPTWLQHLLCLHFGHPLKQYTN